jgi:tRNA threonylcarbamoyladenosine biosynthesis protein TsaE
VHVYGDSRRSACKVYHADLYRIENFHDFETLGMEEVFEKPGVLIVEWAERFPLKAPWPQIRVWLEHLDGDKRRLTVMSEA